MTEEYILFIGQEANLGARTILIPKKEFLEVRMKEFLLLQRCSKKNIVLDNIEIDNFLPLTIIWEGDERTSKIEEYTNVCEILKSYADGEVYSDKKDEIWYSKSILGHSIRGAREFDHIGIYHNILSSGKYNITDSFLYIEVNNIPPYKTGAEIYDDLYFK